MTAVESYSCNEEIWLLLVCPCQLLVTDKIPLCFVLHSHVNKKRSKCIKKVMVRVFYFKNAHTALTLWHIFADKIICTGLGFCVNIKQSTQNDNAKTAFLFVFPVSISPSDLEG